MAVSRHPLYTRHPWLGRAKVTVANAGWDGSGDVQLLLSATVENGLRVRYFSILGIGTVAADLVVFWLDDGTTKTPWRSKLVAAATPGTGIEAAYATLVLPEPLVLPQGWKIWVSTYGGADFWVYAYAGDFEDAE